MKKIHTVSFSRNTNKSGHFHFPVFLIIVAIIIVGIISTLLLLQKNHFNFDAFLGLRDTEKTTEATTAEDETIPITIDTSFAETLNFLIVCENDDREAVFAFLLAFNSNDNEISVTHIDLDSQITVFTGVKTFKAAYSAVDIDHLKDGFLYSGIPITRYLIISEDSFITLTQKLGTVKIDLDKPYSFKVDAITYTIPAGPTEFTSQGLLSYLKGYGLGNEAKTKATNAAKITIETYLNEGNINRGEDLFGYLINLFETDITAFDYYAATDVLNSIITNGYKVTINSETEGDN